MAFLQEQKRPQDSCSPAWVAAHKSGNLEHIAQPAGSATGCRVSCPEASVGLNFF